MSTVISQTFTLFSRLVSIIQSVCSLRRLTLLLPKGTSAPRLYIRQLPPSHCSNASTQSRLNDTPASNETYTSTSDLTDFDDDNERVKHISALTSTPTDVTSTVKSSKDWKPHHPGAYGEYSLSDQNSRTSRSCRPHRRHVLLRGDSADRGHVNVPVYGSPKSTMRGDRCPDDCRTRIPSRIGSDKPRKTPFSQPSSKMKLKETSRLRNKRLASSSCTRGRRYSHSSSDESCPVGDIEVEQKIPDARRITQLETELLRLRSQIARLIVLQEGRQILAASSEEFETRLEGDGESDIDPVGTEEMQLSQAPFVDSDVSRDASPFCPPPPSTPVVIPPPPPLILRSSPPTSQVDWRERLLEMKKQKSESSIAPKSGLVATRKPADMNQVLRELQSGSVKLRSVPRSPGGTPVRAPRSEPDNEMDPCAVIARALKKKFYRVRAVLDRSGSGGENSLGDSFQDSGSEPKSIPPPDLISRPHAVGLSSSTPQFGQHLLKPVRVAPTEFISQSTKNL